MAKYSYLADGRKLSATNAAGNGLIYSGSLAYRKLNGALSLESAAFDGGRFIDGEMHYFFTDHLGSTRAAITISEGDGISIVERNDYYPFGKRYGNTTNTIPNNKYRYSNKEEQSFVDVPYIDYGARMYDPQFRLSWNSIDPLAEKYYGISPYAYCINNPIRYIDPDGKREWPVNKTHNGYIRMHENNYGAPRPTNRRHQGVDINFTGGGNTDKGSPILATHDGIITKVVTIDKNDKNAGGNRVQITSFDKSVSTSYMHLNSISTELSIGSIVSEGQELGTMGGSGYGHQDAYISHLHYEISINGLKVNPVTNANHLLDPQKLIQPVDGGDIPGIVVNGYGNPLLRPIPFVDLEPQLRDLKVEEFKHL